MLNRLFTSTALALLAAATALPAAAELMIAPTRVELDRATRSAELVVVNKGEEEAAFRISVENRRMLQDGSLEAAEEAREGELFAAEMIRYAPRRLMLQPGARQTVRVSAVIPEGLAPGEYRSHLRLMSAPASAGRKLEQTGESDANTLSIELVAIRSLTIPVIVRIGELSAEVEIASAEFGVGGEQEDLLIAHLTRSGDRSTYGDIEVYAEGSAEPVYQARGIAIYTPNTERDVILPIPAEVKAALSGKAVRIAYVSSDPEAPGLIAQIETRLP